MSDERPPNAPQTPTDPAVYLAHVDTAFSIDASPAPVVLTLARVDDAGVRGGSRQFSLFFHGSPVRVVPPGSYVLQHAVLGPLLLFITPVVGSTRERILYEACFNLRVDPGTPR